MAADRDPVVQFQHVRKSYGSAVAVHDLNLDIERGQFVTLLGPSGCGKSTTLRMLGGFETPESGRILLNGKDVTHLPPNRRDVNIVFQDYALFPHLSAARNIAFGLEMRAVPPAQIDKRVRELLALVDLERFGDRLPTQLSGGQRQRVALMRALAPNPQVLLLDEPLSALDAKLRQQMQIELKSIQATTGKTFVFVTHDQEEALTMSDQVIVMNAGRIEQMGDPQTLYRHPRSRFVANFIGEANFVPVRVVDRVAGGAMVEWLGERFPVMAEGPVDPGAAGSVVLRPEAVHVDAARPASGPAVPGRITLRVFRGNHTLLTIAAADGSTVTSSLAPNLLERLTGDDVWLSWNEGSGTLLND